MQKVTTVEENKKLIEKYPWLIPRSLWSGEVIEDYDYSWTELDAMSRGWRIAFGDLLCEDIQAELEKFDWVNKFIILELKSKYGGLRLYYNGVPKGCKVSDIIDDYSHLSEYICEICGELDVPSTDGWIMPVCKECIIKMSIKDPEEYWDKLSEQQTPHTLPLSRRYKIWSLGKDDWEDVTVDLTDRVKRIRKKYAERTGR